MRLAFPDSLKFLSRSAVLSIAVYMKPGDDVDEWGGSEWVEKTPGETKREDELEDLVKKVQLLACLYEYHAGGVPLIRPAIIVNTC